MAEAESSVWVLIEYGRLLFKADVQAEAPSVIYLEDVYLADEFRGTGPAAFFFPPENVQTYQLKVDNEYLSSKLVPHF